MSDLDLGEIRKWLGPEPALASAETAAVRICRRLVNRVTEAEDIIRRNDEVLGEKVARLAETEAMLWHLLKQVNDVERTSVIRESDIYRRASSLLASRP